jgi:hypothetical protein
LEEFYRWWDSYELGLKVLVQGERIVGAFGLWPLSEEVARAFKDGRIVEHDLTPLTTTAPDSLPSSHWYASGIVLARVLRKLHTLNPLITLLAVGLNIWMESGHVKYPAEITAMGYSEEGRRMIERFGFIKLRDMCSDHDRFPLYCLRVRTRSDLIGVLRKRGL